MFQLVKCIYQSVQTQYGYNLSGPFLQNLEEESIWPMLAIESLKALGGPGLLSLGGKYLLRCIFEVGIIFLIITQSRCLVGIFEFGTVFLLHLCRKKTLSFQLIEKKLKRRWRLCVKSLQGNRLTGKIPEVIGLMQALAVFSGLILEFGQKLESLTYLNFSSNNFKGRIPVELGRIINLDTLLLGKELRKRSKREQGAELLDFKTKQLLPTLIEEEQGSTNHVNFFYQIAATFSLKAVDSMGRTE
ncbi:uncharacterized protein LOC131249437 isoform X4 [Magnolia sinica]|uniref:uncharacterized protein LOC131249437 isoform X4 n=1 Tax=Magnolia sinica TaxID=86752 RepID=UPI00265A3965|nr:uncharacterized protein LOC131249437 isoform X4 [Magnolia sinica]